MGFRSIVDHCGVVAPGDVNLRVPGMAPRSLGRRSQSVDGVGGVQKHRTLATVHGETMGHHWFFFHGLRLL